LLAVVLITSLIAFPIEALIFSTFTLVPVAAALPYLTRVAGGCYYLGKGLGTGGFNEATLDFLGLGSIADTATTTSSLTSSFSSIFLETFRGASYGILEGGSLLGLSLFYC
jgi:hypothetical protein